MKATSVGSHAPRRLSRVRLNRRLLSRGVGEVQIAYCEFDGYLSATLSVSSNTARPARIRLPRRLRNEIKRLFENIAYECHHDATLLDRAGMIVWDLASDSISHRHCGYRQQYFSANENVSTEHESETQRSEL
jgi:hypothetical protein